MADEAARRREIMAWRRQERERLIAARLAIPAAGRTFMGEAIAGLLEGELGDVAGRTISFYWPFRGEPDLRPLMERLSQKGAISALPVVVEKGRPLEFRSWRQGEALERGIWNIPVPAQRRVVTPDIAVAPVVGFDAQCYRLGYGGGYFDRTLAALDPRPRLIGVGYGMQRIATIRPLAHDIATSGVVTEEGVARPTDA